jgi:glycosyltransferase involved in cell wall biosynthesis
MNRLVTENVRDVAPDRLPPHRRQGPARILFINHNLLGHVTQARNIRQYCQNRSDIDAVHVDLVRPFWIKVANTSLPLVGHCDLRHYRSLLLWRPIIRRWLRGPLDLSRFDVVHFLNPHYAWGLVQMKARALFGHVRIAIHTDCTSVLLHRELGWPWAAEKPVIDIERRIYGASDLLVAMSEWSAASMRNDYHLPPERVWLTRGCVLGPPTAAPAADRRADTPGRLPKILFVGNDWVRKGGPTLVRVHQQHFAERAELHIVSQQAIPDAAARNVFWHGSVPHEKLLAELMSGADLMAMPTSNDMSPFAVLEAAAAGLPVVSTRMGGIPEMVLDGQTGLLFDPGAADGFVRAVDRLLGDPGLRRQMGQAARSHVASQFDPDVNYTGLLDRLVALADEQPVPDPGPPDLAATTPAATRASGNTAR